MQHKREATITHIFTLTEEEATAITTHFINNGVNEDTPGAVGKFYYLLGYRNSDW